MNSNQESNQPNFTESEDTANNEAEERAHTEPSTHRM